MVHGKYRPSPVRSSVHMNFSCNVVVVKRKAVIQAFERAIHLFSRPTDPAIESGAQQVGSHMQIATGSRSGASQSNNHSDK